MAAIRPMTDAEFAAWLDGAIPRYAREKVASGAWAEANALELSIAEHRQLLPDGRATQDHFFHSIVAEDGGSVGMLWFAAKERGGARIAYLYNIEIDPGHRRRGHARRALEALEREVARLGLAGIALHVFGHNASGQALYAKLGYVTTNINMHKPVDGAGD
jgi:ribosomal protein S18 acetylase RimI-like enzyme